MPNWYRALMVVAVFGFAWAGLHLGRNGSLILAVLPLLVSSISMYVLRLSLEYGKPAGMFNPATQSWAFLMDAVALPLAFGAAALSWRTLAGQSAYYETRWWTALAAVIGMIAAIAFREVINAPGYHEGGFSDLLGSPTSLWHDFVVYPVLVTVFVAICLPAMFHDFSGFGKYVLIGLLIWVAGGIADATIHKLDVQNLHPPVQETRLAP